MPLADSSIAVVAIIVQNDYCLFLERTRPPKNWCPPCGRLKIGEDPIQGLIREVFEETQLAITPLLPVAVWTGTHNDQSILSITYVCTTESTNVQFSEEHSDYTWIALEQLISIPIDTDFNTNNWPALIKMAKAYAAGSY